MKTYEWTQEQINSLAGKKVRVPGALCRPGPTADQDLMVVSVVHDPNYRGGAYVRFAPERYQPQPPGGCLAIGLLDPSTVQDIPKPPPESLDGKHDEREKEIRRLRDLLAEGSGSYGTVSELVALEVKQVAQRYEARIEQRVKDEVENRTHTIRTDAESKIKAVDAAYALGKEDGLDLARANMTALRKRVVRLADAFNKVSDLLEAVDCAADDLCDEVDATADDIGELMASVGLSGESIGLSEEEEEEEEEEEV